MPIAESAAPGVEGVIQSGRAVLTVVIPAFNVEKYIGRCLESVLIQAETSGLIDVVVVIDGATDSTETVARTVVAGFKQPCVRFVSQSNQGLSAARNAGSAVAVTEYITFLDGDDVWLPDYAGTVLNLLEYGCPDIVEYDALHIDEYGNNMGLVKIASSASGVVASGSREMFLASFMCFTWARVFRTALVRSRLFPHGRRFEDTATTPWYYWSARQIVSVGVPLIGYRQRAASILATPKETDIKDIACTTIEASAEYDDTGSDYWRRVTYRSFQQACSRITLLPLNRWRSCLVISKGAVGSVPAPSGFARRLQVKAPLLYVAMLWLKRRFVQGR